ncbi:MAG: MFS transporter [Bacteroidales bacterium]|nr:MFS transporter [Bacteroidales bacterium]
MSANFMLYFSFYLLTPLLPLYLSEAFGATKDMIGLVLTGYTVTAILTRPLSGFLVDSYPRKKVLMWCFFLFFIFFGGYLAAGTMLMFAIIRTLHGAPFGALTVANSTVAIDVLASSRRTEGIGLYGLSNNIAMAVSPTVGIVVYDYTKNFMLLFWIALVIALIGLLIDSRVTVRERELVKCRQKLSLDRFFLVGGWLLAVNMVFFGFCFGVLSNYLAIYGRDELGITGGTGMYFMVLSVGLIASRLQGSKGLREGRLVRNAVEGTILSAVGYTVFVAVRNEYGYYLSALLIGLGNGHLWPAFQNMMIQIASNNQRGTANSTIFVSWDAGLGLGVLIGGVIAELFGYRAAFWTVSVAHIIGTGLFIMRSRQFFEKRRLQR